MTIRRSAFAHRISIRISTLSAVFSLILFSLPVRADDMSWAQIYAASASHSRPEDGRASAAPSRNAGGAVEMGSSVAHRVAEVAARHGVPARFAIAVARIESGLRCQARGRAGELGPLQIKPSTARGLGYTGPAAALNSCGAGLEWGMRHLAAAYRRCGSGAGAAALHNRGLASSCTRTAYSNAVARRMASL